MIYLEVSLIKLLASVQTNTKTLDESLDKSDSDRKKAGVK